MALDYSLYQMPKHSSNIFTIYARNNYLNLK